MLFSAILLAGWGCDTVTEETLEPLIPMDSAPVKINIGSATGLGGVLRVPVRMVNSREASVPGADLTLQAGGTQSTIQAEVNIDGLGFGTGEFSFSSSQLVDVSLVGTPDGLQASTESVQSTVLQGRPDQVELMPVYQAEMTPDRIHQAEGGAAMIQTNEVWWQPFAHGAPPQLVAALNNPIINSRSVDVDADGLSDLLLWNRTEVALLRGHPQGGLAWGLGWETSAEVSVEWVTPGDANGDSTMDVVMLISQNQDLSVIVLNGNGAWNFTLTPQKLDIPAGVSSISAGLHTSEGAHGVHTLDTSGEIRAYALRDEVWGTVGEPLSLTVHPSAWLDPARDLTGDGLVELIIVEPEVESGPREVSFLSFAPSATRFEIEFEAFSSDWADMNRDGQIDLVVAEGGAEPSLWMVTAREGGGSFLRKELASLPSHGDLIAADGDGDGVPEVMIQDEDRNIYILEGELEDDDWDDWQARWTTWSVDLVSPVKLVDLEGDGISELILVRIREDRSSLSILYFEEEKGEQTLKTLHRADVDVFDEGVIASALAVDYCDGTVYGLVDDGARYVVAMADEGDTQELPADSVAMEAYAIACGDFEKGALAVLTDSEVVFFNSSLVETGRDSVSAVAIAAGDAEGLGLDQALVCSSEGCDLAAGDVDGDGVDEVLVVQTSGSTLRLGAETFELPGGTHAGMLELDDDGLPEATLFDTDVQAMWVQETLTSGAGPLLQWRINRQLSGPLFRGDLDGDGSPEFVGWTDEGQIIHSSFDR